VWVPTCAQLRRLQAALKMLLMFGSDILGGDEPTMMTGGLALLDDHRSSLCFFAMGLRSDRSIAPEHKSKFVWAKPFKHLA